MGAAQVGALCECKDVLTKIVHADAVDENMHMVSGADEMEAKPDSLEVCKAVKISSPNLGQKPQRVQARPKVDDKDGGSYQGEWLGCFRHGKGTQVWADGTRYSGQWYHDLPHGHGKLEQGDVYEGQWKYGKACGHGKHIATNKVRYEGEWHNDQKHGHGEEHYADGGRYSGSYDEGNKSGEGIYRWPDGSEYRGHFCENFFTGQGRQKWADGRSYDGQWQANVMHGHGRFRWPDGQTYVGSYRNGLRHGKGKFQWPDGRVYDGEWEDGKQHGKGILEAVNEDFLAEEGTLVFTPGEYEQTQMFRVILEEPEGGAKFDESTDGGDETCILTVFIKTDVVIRDPIDKMRSTLAVRWGKAKTGNANWGRQFKDAVFDVYGDDDDLDEDEERTVGQKAYAWSFHVIQLPWKIVFAFIPPTDYCGGWVCFCFSLIFIGLVTAIIGDVAAIFGCCLGIKAMGTAITFVALGTSLPDTFASKTAAQQDPHADASVGNVTGSNSVNVFLGLGMPWTIGAIYWAAGANDEWRRKFGPGTEPHLKIPEAFREGAFIVQAGDLAFSVTVFSICAVLCVAILAARRRLFGGELGGPLPAKIVSAVLMISLWLVYIGMSFWKMETS